MTAPRLRRTGIDRIVHATLNSLNGLKFAYRGEAAFRQEAWAAIVLLPAAFLVGRDLVEAALLAGSVLLVLVVELLNSAVEAVVDRVSLEWHELSRRAKDIASAAVMLSLLACGGMWTAVCVQRWVMQP